MKNLIITTIAIAGIITVVSAQSALQTVKHTVGNTEIIKNWSVGETKKVHDAVITRLAGDNHPAHRTNVFYVSNETRARLIRDRSEVKLSKEEQNALIECALRPTGGQIALFFDWAEWALAGSGFFTVEVKNEFGETLFTDKPEYVQPAFYKWEVWYGFVVINVPQNLGSKFTIHVKDQGWEQDFAFSVSIPQQPEIKSISAMR